MTTASSKQRSYFFSSLSLSTPSTLLPTLSSKLASRKILLLTLLHVDKQKQVEEEQEDQESESESEQKRKEIMKTTTLYNHDDWIRHREPGRNTKDLEKPLLVSMFGLVFLLSLGVLSGNITVHLPPT